MQYSFDFEENTIIITTEIAQEAIDKAEESVCIN
jgi:hypothetical protein